MISKFLIITTLFGAVILSPFSNSVMARTISHPNHYDHATIGEHFDPYSMVTKMTGSRYDRMGKNLFGVMNTLMAQFAVS